MGKNTDVEQARKAVALAKKYISLLEISFMLGYIGKNKETLKETVRFSKEIGIRPLIFYATAFPGTELYKMAVQRGFVNDEEGYLMRLDQHSINKFSLNLTDIQDKKEAETEIGCAIKEIEKFYLWKEIKKFKIYKYLISKLQEEGFKKTIKVILTKIKKLF